MALAVYLPEKKKPIDHYDPEGSCINKNPLGVQSGELLVANGLQRIEFVHT